MIPCQCEPGQEQLKKTGGSIVGVRTYERFMKPNNKIFYESDSYSEILKDAGIKTIGSKNQSITSMVLDREMGKFKYGGFSSAHKCRLSNNYLPNIMHGINTNSDSIIQHIAYTQDGEYLITVTSMSPQCKVQFYNANFDVDKEVNTCYGIDTDPLRFSLSKEHFAYTLSTGKIFMISLSIDSTDQKLITPLTLDNNDIIRSCIDFSGDGKEILGGTENGIIYIYDLNSNQVARRIVTGEQKIKMSVFGEPSSNMIYSFNCYSKNIKIWDKRMSCSVSEICKPARILAGHSGMITYLKSKGDGRHLLTQSKDSSIKLWDVRNSISPSSQITPETDASMITFLGHKSSIVVPYCDFSPLASTGQRYVYTSCFHGNLCLYDIATNRIETRISPGGNNCRAQFAWHPNKNEIVVGGFPKYLIQWSYCGFEPLIES